MHELLHIAVLVGVVGGGAALALLVVWPLASGSPMPPATRNGLLLGVFLALFVLVLEWRVVH